MNKKIIILSILIIVFIVSLIYSNSLNVPFQFDDVKRIVGIRFLQSINLKEIFSHSKSRFLLHLSFAINYYFGRYNVLGYHLLNLVIHIVSSIFVFLLYLSIFESSRFVVHHSKKDRYILSFLSSLIYAVHPLHTGAVTYIWQRGESMAGMFYFLSIFLYVKFRLTKIQQLDGKNNPLYYFFCLVSIIFSSITKPTSVSLPVAILLYELYFLSRDSKEFKESLRFLFPILVCIVFPVLLAIYDVGESKNVGVRFSSYYMPYYYTKLRVLAVAIRLMFVPVNQTIAYHFEWSKSLGNPISTFYSLILHISLIILSIFTFRRYRVISFAIVWFYLTLLGTTILYLEDLFFEHYLYLPLFAYGLLLAVCGINLIYRMHIQRKWVICLFIILVVIYSFGTYKRNKVWQTEISLWEDAVKKSPGDARANYTLGVYYFRAKRYEEALERYKLALIYRPAYAEAYYRLGEYYFALGDTGASIANYKVAIQINPDFFEAYINLGNVYLESQRFKDADVCFTNALRLTDDPYYKEEIRHILKYIETRKHL